MAMDMIVPTITRRRMTASTMIQLMEGAVVTAMTMPPTAMTGA